MRETNTASLDYETKESTEVPHLKSTTDTTAKMDIEDSLYGKDKPRRVKIERKIVSDSG